MSILPVANNLRNPAVPVDNVYQSSSNLKASASRVLARNCYEKDFDSKFMGGSSITLVVPSNALFSDVLVYFKFNGLVQEGYYLPPAWGYKAIRDITWIWGGSEQLRITGEANFLRAMNEAEDDRKKTAIIELGGARVSVARGAGATQVNTDASVHIYCPNSSVNAMRQIPFDADLLNGNITIRIALRAASELWCQMKTSTEGALAAITNEMSQFEVARWYLRQYALIDTTASKKELVGPNGDYMQQYFFYHSQTFNGGEGAIVETAGVKPGGISARVNVTLNGFTNGSLQALTLYVQRTDQSYQNEVLVAGAPTPSFMDCRKLRNIELKYNGECIYKGEHDKVAKLMDLSLHHTDSTYNLLQLQRTATDVIDKPGNGRANIYRIQLSQFSEVFRDYLQTGAELSANTMQLSFDIEDPELALNSGIRAYTCKVEYIYQASVGVQKGVGSFHFMNPLPAPGPQVLALAPQ